MPGQTDGHRSEEITLVDFGSCPICASMRVTIEIGDVRDCRFGGGDRWRLVRCNECGVVWTDPRPTLERRLYPPEFYERICESVPNSDFALRAINLLSGYQYPHTAPTGCQSLLEVGCGTGENLRVLKARGLRVKGIEPEPHAVLHCRASGLDVLQGTAEGTLGSVTDKFDWVLLNHVIEHLDHPVEVLRLCRDRMNGGGTLTLALPCYDTLGVRFFGGCWDPLDVPRHTYHFSQEALNRVLNMSGFRVLRTEFQLNPFPFARSMLCKSSHGDAGYWNSYRRLKVIAPLLLPWIPVVLLGRLLMQGGVAPYFRVDASIRSPA